MSEKILRATPKRCHWIFRLVIWGKKEFFGVSSLMCICHIGDKERGNQAMRLCLPCDGVFVVEIGIKMQSGVIFKEKRVECKKGQLAAGEVGKDGARMVLHLPLDLWRAVGIRVHMAIAVSFLVPQLWLQTFFVSIPGVPPSIFPALPCSPGPALPARGDGITV